MFYVSKITPIFFLFALFNLVLSLFLKLTGNFELFVFTLVWGFVGLTLTGAMYQIVPNSQNRKLSKPKVSYLVFLAILYGFLNAYFGNLVGGSLVLMFAYAGFLFHILTNIKNFMPVTVKFLTVSAAYLTLSYFFLFFSALGVLPLQLSVHALTVGSMLNAIYGVELAWIPMLLMETLNVKKAQRLFWAKQVSTLAVILAFITMNYKLIALSMFLELGVALYFIYLNYELLTKRRMPTKLPPVVKIFLTALSLLPFGIVAGGFLASRPEVIAFARDLHIDIILYGFGAFTIFGGMLHLLPRIMWNWKAQEGTPEITIADLLDEKSVQFFLEAGALLYIIFLAIDLTFEPVSVLAVVPYILIVGLLFKNLLKSLLLPLS